MGWSDQWGGSGGIVASSVQVVNGQTVVASITPNGDINGQTITAQGDILLKGASLTTTLSNIPKGVIAQTTIPAAHLPTGSFGATELSLFELDVILSAGRQYGISLSNMVFQATAAGCRAAVFVHYTTDGTAPTTASSQLYEVWENLETTDGLFDIIPDHSITLNVATQTNLRMLVTSVNQIISPTAQQTHKFIAAGTGIGNVGAMMQVIDQGPTVPDTGVFGGGATAIFRSFFTIATDSQSFTGSGNASQGSGANNAYYMYFGQDPGFAGNGVWRSYAWFNLADTGGGNGLGSISNMSGVSLANVQYLDMFVYTAWWYAVAGGTLYVGHGITPVSHGTEGGGNSPREMTIPFNGRGQGAWVSLLGTPIGTAILNGTFTSILLGPPPTSSFSSYGYASGATAPGGKPCIRAGYYK